MRIMIVDDEKYAMKQLCSVVEQVAPGAEIVCINECDDAVEAANIKTMMWHSLIFRCRKRMDLSWQKN